MSIPSQAHIFEAGLNSSSSGTAAVPKPMSLDNLVRQKIAMFPASGGPTGRRYSSSMPPPPAQQAHLLNDMGDYFLRTAANWAMLTESLLVGEHIEHVTREVHRQAQSRSGLADLSSITALDMDMEKLR